MKRIIAIVLSSVLALSLFSCSAQGQGQGGQNAEKQTQADHTISGKLIGFSQSDSMSSWRTTETDSITKAVQEAGAKMIVKDAGGDIATQESDIRDLIAAKVDLLVVAPLENHGLQGALEEAMQAHIPVILVDRAVEGEVGKHYTTAIASDFVLEGQLCAEALNKALPEGGNVVIINGGYDSVTSTDRQEGFIKVLGPKFKIIAEQDGSWLMDKAQAVMENIIQAKGKDQIHAVFAVTDDMVQGAMNAAKAAGLEPGKDIHFVGIDGTKAALEAVKEGRQLASCTCTPYFGPIVVETATKILKGEAVEAKIINPDVLYTKDNVDVKKGF